MKIPVIDYIHCNGCGTCATMCPEVFYMSHEKAWVRDGDVVEGCELREVWRSCPARCISFVEIGEDGTREIAGCP